MKKIVVFTGAGVSAESGLGTFRDADGLWDKYRIEDVCTHDAWLRNPQLCVEFYNARRRDALAAEPNAAHYALTKLQKAYPTMEIITQNIDNLHERAGSQHITHLHGEITKLRSSVDEVATIEIGNRDQRYGERHPDGSLLRPYIVFFGEGVPYFHTACNIAATADIFIVVGTSLVVYPAASLLNYVPDEAKIYVVDPGNPDISAFGRAVHIQEKASVGVPRLVEQLLEER